MRPRTLRIQLINHIQKTTGNSAGEPLLVGSRYNVSGCITMIPKDRVRIAVCTRLKGSLTHIVLSLDGVQHFIP